MSSEADPPREESLPTNLNTNVLPSNPPEIDVDVGNGGGGPGSKAYAIMCISWDPDVMQFLSVDKPTSDYVVDAADGYCLWYGHGIAWGAKRNYRISLCRRKEGDTWVVACAMDPKWGDWDSDESKISDDHESCDESERTTGGRKKTTKKAKKKVGKKGRRA